MPIWLRTARICAAGRRVRRAGGVLGEAERLAVDLDHAGVGSSRKARQRSSVLLPEPEGPITQVDLAAGDFEIDAVQDAVVAEATC